MEKLTEKNRTVFKLVADLTGQNCPGIKIFEDSVMAIGFILFALGMATSLVLFCKLALLIYDELHEAMPRSLLQQRNYFDC